ncbi:flagellar biosynthesis protein FliZ [Alkalibaculum sp. M08DMB]|uniref:Flagellar biosynthesis protein FliZ n=1 Tax=Alkalibaculum sporogenes TaxID=2655001 RepID=A0A6A7K612_9FIRM|nr:flagellar biosynthetic protein FliO [Alkalibaculum sporogenes]MPW24804.1 flagellar biosynthesis protein FliZ [Alkalibaculum sporogenes]
MSGQMFLSVIKTIVVLLMIIALANISLKLGNKYITKHNKIIKIVERVSVSNNSSLCIVDICGSYYLMSFSGNDNKILKDLDEEKVQEILAEIQKEQSIPNYMNLSEIKAKTHNFFEMRKKS